MSTGSVRTNQGRVPSSHVRVPGSTAPQVRSKSRSPYPSASSSVERSGAPSTGALVPPSRAVASTGPQNRRAATDRAPMTGPPGASRANKLHSSSALVARISSNGEGRGPAPRRSLRASGRQQSLSGWGRPHGQEPSAPSRPSLWVGRGVGAAMEGVGGTGSSRVLAPASNRGVGASGSRLHLTATSEDIPEVKRSFLMGGQHGGAARRRHDRREARGGCATVRKTKGVCT